MDERYTGPPPQSPPPPPRREPSARITADGVTVRIDPPTDATPPKPHANGNQYRHRLVPLHHNFGLPIVKPSIDPADKRAIRKAIKKLKRMRDRPRVEFRDTNITFPAEPAAAKENP